MCRLGNSDKKTGIRTQSAQMLPSFNLELLHPTDAGPEDTEFQPYTG